MRSLPLLCCLLVVVVTPGSAQPSCLLDLVLVVDSSGSIRDQNVVGAEDNWTLMLRFMSDLIAHFHVSPGGTQVGVVTFSNEGYNEFFMDRSATLQDVQAKILKLPYRGANTNTSGGLREMHERQFTSQHGDRPNVANVAIVLTDGVSTYDSQLTIPEAMKARAKQIKIFVVGVTKSIKESEVGAMSSLPQTKGLNYFLSDDFGTLNTIAPIIIQQTCLAARPTPAPTPRPGPLAVCSASFVDMVFIVDSSGSIRDKNPPGGFPDNFELMKAFVKSMVTHLPIGRFHVQVGFIDFSTTASNIFYLNSYNDVEQIKNAINNIPYYGSHTNTSGAIRLMTRQFHSSQGDRPNAKNYAVILTDGVSTIDSHRTIPDAEAARAQGIEIFSIGVTNAVDEIELRAISSYPHLRSQTYWLASTFAELDSIVQTITSTICQFLPEPPRPTPAPVFPGPPGATGLPGPSGFPGPLGPNGIPGPSGVRGLPGFPGTGFAGLPGSQGWTGAQGPPGSAGVRGAHGSDGLPGRTGAAGEPGQPGFGQPGQPGSNGRPGRSGATGFPGLAGRAGQPGFSGPVGPAGPLGADGPPGLVGSPGFPGLTGVAGLSGVPGAPGNPGLPGTSGALGERGATGQPGQPGPQGTQGISGRAGSSGEPGSSGFPGTRGRNGLPGRTGGTGRPGFPGGPGPVGLSGPSGQPGSNGLPGFPGNPGATGITGQRGPIGQPGQPGFDGSSGATGLSGVPGRPGATGFVGAPGHTGSTGFGGSPGFSGATGATGTVGFPGGRGVSGPLGPSGFPGPSGRDGANGLPGNTGSTGKAGFRGFPGPLGPVGRPGRTGATGVGGPLGLSGPRGIGRPGSPGNAGPQGFPGATGSTGLSGITGATGSIGAAGSRGFPGSAGTSGQPGFPGPVGPAGSTGVPGFSGLQGGPGQQGLNGETGATGLGGPIGRPGPAGPVGPKGNTGGTGLSGFPGPLGIDGRPGPQGFPGSTGLPGGPGFPGAPGPVGPPGFFGRTGATGFAGPVGPGGRSGPLGPAGPRGPAGGPGFIGPIGPIGPPGQTGATGGDGGPGSSGQFGPPGPPGFPGSVGQPGLSGRTGATGSPGQPGPLGPAGFPGQGGRGGETGATGFSGPSGFPGNAGPAGQSGPVGFPGPIGPLGPIGLPGKTGGFGQMGATGEVGPSGFPGRDGSTGQPGVPGPPGLIGRTGATGQPGLQGLKGHLGRVGPLGFPGLKGNSGATGSPGFPGLSGPIGSVGRGGSPGSRGFPGRPGLAGNRGFPGNPGPLGPPGGPGSPGVPGAAGRTGSPGGRGFPGNAGATGQVGSPGFPGQPGANGNAGSTGGSGVPGRPGISGSPGAPGAPGFGFPGATGLPGIRGNPGPQGPRGPSGTNGLPGPLGPAGVGGPQGPSGQPGPPGVGSPGFPGTDGQPGSVGPVGLPGPQGAPGNPGPVGYPGPAGLPGDCTTGCGKCSPGNRCARGNAGCQQRCVNTMDSYFCTCRKGYQVLNDVINCPGVKPVLPACSEVVLDIVFVIDSSGSIRDTNPANGAYDNWTLLLDFIINLLDKLNVGRLGTHVGLVVYSNRANNEFFLNTYSGEVEVEQAVRRTPYIGGYTNTSGGLRAMMHDQFTFRRGDRPNVPNVAIVITDGHSNLDSARTAADAAVAQGRGIQMFSLGITSEVMLSELIALASPPKIKNQNYYEADSFNQLNHKLTTKLLSQTCTSHNIPSCNNAKIDLVFVVDSSGSIRDNNIPGDIDNWKQVLMFLSALVEMLEISADTNRIGLVRFADAGENMWYMNSYTDHDSLTAAINKISYMGHNTNTSGGLRVMMQDQFTAAHGDRPEAKNIAIVLTDGSSTVDKERTITDAIEARNAMIQIFTIGVSNRINETELKLMSSLPQIKGKNYFTSTRFSELDKIKVMLLEKTCTIATAFAASNPADNQKLLVSKTNNFFCRWTAEAGYICFCKYSDCDVRPTNGSQCMNLNECQNGNNGGCEQECIDNDGSYSCRCRRGYRLAIDRLACDDVNECQQGNRCSFGQICLNTFGGYYCVQTNVIQHFSPLTALDSAKEASTSGHSTWTIAFTAGIAALLCVMSVLALLLGVRHFRKSRMQSGYASQRERLTNGSASSECSSVSYTSTSGSLNDTAPLESGGIRTVA